MSVIIGAIMGVFIGISIFALVSITKINELEDKNYETKQKYLNEKMKVEQRDKFIARYQKEQTIILDNAYEDRQLMKNLLINLNKVLYSNVHDEKKKLDKIKELVEDCESNN